jgi:hypothetical protein
MRSLLLVIGTVIFALSAAARDSTWLVCTSDSLAISTHEHRAGDGRATSLTLIYGVHELRGTLKNSDSGQVTLKANGKAGTEFTGKIAINYDTTAITAAGVLKIDGEPFDIDAAFECKEMSTEL